MLSVKVIRLDFMKASARVLNACRRSIGVKNNPIWENQENITANYIKAIKDSNLQPRGFEIIYASPLVKTLKINYTLLPYLWGFLCLDVYVVWKRVTDVEEPTEKKFTTLSKKDLILTLGGTTVLILLLHIIPKRVVLAIFRRGDEFQSLFYGFFGLASRSYVHHGPQAVVSTKHPVMYRLKGKTVMVFTYGFKDMESLYSVVKLGES